MLIKWLTSQEPTKLAYFKKEKDIIKNYLTDVDRLYIEEDLKNHFSGDQKTIRDLIQKTLDHCKPFVLYTSGQFQAVNDEVFTIDGVAFSSAEICNILKRSEFVFPHIISTGHEIEEYALAHTEKLHRAIIREVASRVNALGQSTLIEKLSENHDLKQILPVFPGEPGWERQQGIRIFEIFGDLPEKHYLTITKKGMTNIAYTSFGLLIAN